MEQLSRVTDRPVVLASHYPLILMFNDYAPEFELSRILRANVWQKREELGAKHAFNWAAGLPSARNVVLRIQRRVWEWEPSGLVRIVHRKSINCSCIGSRSDEVWLDRYAIVIKSVNFS